MNALLPKFLDVTIPWAMRHEWEAGQCYQDPDDESQMYSIWLFLEGEANVTMGGRQWHVGPNTAALWPTRARRDIVTPQGAHWFRYADESTLGRSMDGENGNVGFISITDTPYPELVAAARQVHGEIYTRRFGKG